MSNPFPNRSGNTATAASRSNAFDADVVKDDDPYASDVPAGISEYKISDFVGEFIMVEPTEYIESMLTSASKDPTDVFRVNVIPLTGEHAGEQLDDLMVFQVALKRALMKTWKGPKPWLRARLEMGNAKPGWSAPYVFVAPTEEDEAIYRKFVASRS